MSSGPLILLRENPILPNPPVIANLSGDQARSSGADSGRNTREITPEREKERVVRNLAFLAGLSLLSGVPVSAQELPKVELFGGYSFLRSERNDLQGRNFQGWNAWVAGNVNDRLGIVGDLDRHYGSSGSIPVRDLSFLFGPRLSYRRHDRLTPYLQVLAGVARSTFDFSGFGISSSSRSSFAFAVGGGLDLTLNRRLAARLLQVDYSRTSFGGAVCPAVFPPPRDCGSLGQSALRISAGAVLRLGTK